MAKDDKRSELAVLVTTRIEDISNKKSQREIAEEVGFPSTNIMSIIKRGGTKLSLDRVRAMAKALELDIKTVMIPALRQYYTDKVIDDIRDTFDTAKTKTEREILQLAQKHGDIYEPLSDETREALIKVFESTKN